MKKECIVLNDIKFTVYSLNTVIVGSGAAGLNAADRLYHYGQKDIAIVTEGFNMGTSRNTGSDKQTYYKLTLCGKENDSVDEMAKTLFDGGSMDGDIAMVEAAISTQCFYHLVEIGVPFPFNRYGEYVGYKTDHDPSQRATSVGPLTSKMMTEKLETRVKENGIKIFDKYKVIGILIDKVNNKSVGIVTLNMNGLDKIQERYVLFNCTNIVYAVGGPAGIYDMSVYPYSQSGSSGIAFEAGIKGKNLTESQYGIASIKFRWNLSGTYQQVIPRYISTDQDGNDEREFLNEYFKDPGKMMDAVFLKGYQWPFDPRKIENFGSSLVDILVYNETVLKGRRVFLDYTRNPSFGSNDNGELNFSLLGSESYNYLKNSKVLFGKPIDRLKFMNEPGIELYKSNGIDITKEYLEIAVCAQHNNGGLYGNVWWESNVKHFFPVGEVNGTHGVYRPGGSALNSGQVGSTRAAQFISMRYKDAELHVDEFINICGEQLLNKAKMGEGFLKRISHDSNVVSIKNDIGRRMTENGAHIREISSVEKAICETKELLDNISDVIKIRSVNGLPYAFQDYDLLVTQYVYLCAIYDYIKNGGKSRGSYLISDDTGIIEIKGLEKPIKFGLDDGSLSKKIQLTTFEEGKCTFQWRDVIPLPDEENWFENVWKSYRNDEIVR